MPIFAVLAYKNGVNVQTLLFLRFGFAAIILFLYIFARGGKISVTRKDLISFVFLGGVCYTLQSTCYFSSIQYISASMAGIILYSYPIFVYILSVLVDREKVNMKIILSIAVSFFGLILILGTSMGTLNLTGVLFAFAAAGIYSVYIIFGNHTVRNTSPLITSAFVILFTALGQFVLGFASKRINFGFEGGVWFSVAGLVLISTLLAILAFFRGLELLGATNTSVLSMMEPVFTAVFSILFLSESLTPFQIIGGAAVLGGAVLIAVVQGRKTHEETDSLKG